MVVSRDVCLIGRDRSLSDSFHLVRMMERMETSGMVTVSERKRINFQDFANGTQPFAQIHMFFFTVKCINDGHSRTHYQRVMKIGREKKSAKG